MLKYRDPSPANHPFRIAGTHFAGSGFLYNEAGLTDVSDSYFLSSSQWVKIPVAPDESFVLFDWQPDSTQVPSLWLNADGSINLFGASADNNVAAWNSDPDAFTFDTDWKNILVCMDTNADAGEKIAHLFIDDAEIDLTPVDTHDAALSLFASQPVGIPDDNRVNAYELVTGDASDWWIGPGVYLDFTIQGNRRKFITAGGKPVWLGQHGERPTGTAPAIFLGGDRILFPRNRGTGGALTLSGTLTNATTSPSD